MFRFCIADSEHDWREGSEQYKFIEKCLATADRQKQPWLIFIAHRVLGYSSSYWEGDSFGEPMGRENLQKLWQKYKVDIACFGHAHNYERTCPIYQVWPRQKWRCLCTCINLTPKFKPMNMATIFLNCFQTKMMTTLVPKPKSTLNLTCQAPSIR